MSFLLRKFLPNLSLLLIFASSVLSFAQEQDLVLIVRNSDSGPAVMAEDYASERKVSEGLKHLIGAMGSQAQVEEIKIDNLDLLSQSILAQTKSRHLRGLIFIGHGNEQVYALNAKEIYTPETMAKLTDDVIKSPVVHGPLTIYFAGCKMAGTSKSSSTFQEIFYERLVHANLMRRNNLELEVIAHSYGVDHDSGSFSPASTLDVFAVKSHLGQFFQRYHLLLSPWLGGYSPSIMNALTVVTPGLLAVAAFPGYRQEGVALGFAMMGLSRVFSSGAGKLGKSISKAGNKTGFVYDLLKNGLTCENELSK